MAADPGVTSAKEGAGCQPTRYPFRRLGPALVGMVFAVFAIPLLAAAVLLDAGTALFSVGMGLAAGLFATFHLSRAFGTQELRLSREGVEVARGAVWTRVPWAGVASVEARDERARMNTTDSRTTAISGVMVGLGLRQTVLDITLNGSRPAEFGGLAGPLLRKVRSMAGSAKLVSINLSELHSASRSTVVDDIQRCLAASREAKGIG